MRFLVERLGESISNIVLRINSPKIDLVPKDRVLDKEPLDIKPSSTVLTRFLCYKQLSVDIVYKNNDRVSYIR